MQSAISSCHPKYRTKLCRHFASGDCPFGRKCCFLHLAPGIDPSSSLLASQHFNWNPLLVQQLLALSNQQTTQKTMPRRSPPRSQGPQLVVEDLLPPTSLLLSTSDCITSEQVPQSKRASRQKKCACKHFIRTGGRCLAGGRCKFLHDVTVLPSAGDRKAERTPPFATDAHGRTISGGVLMGIQSPSPPIVRQAHSKPAGYTEAELMRRSQAMYWFNYSWQPYQPHYSSVPATAAILIPATPPSSTLQQNLCHLPQSQTQVVPPNETRTTVPLGTYEVNGTTYFPTSVPSVCGSSSIPYSVPTHPLPYNHAYYAPPGMPAGYYDAANARTDPASQPSFDPFASDPMVPRDLPVVLRLEDYQMSPVQQDVIAIPRSEVSPLVTSGDLGLTTTTSRSKPMDEFPYQPPKDQRVGHARRISVNIKKRGRSNSG